MRRMRPRLVSDDLSALPDLLDEVLVGAGTTVWSWDAVEDRLGGINCSVAMLGYAPDEVPWTQAGWDTLIHPDDRAAAEAAFERHRRGEAERYECEYRARGADGQWRWLLERGQVATWQSPGVARRVVGTLTDIGPRKRAEHQAQALRDRLSQLAVHVPGMLYQYVEDALGNGRFVYASEGAQALFGLSPAQLVADPAALTRLIARDELARLAVTLRRSAQGLTPWRETFRVFPPGAAGPRWVLVEATPRRDPDGLGGHELTWHGYVQDVTERRALDLARAEAAAAAAASRAKTEFLSRVSHELRTPLNAVMGFAQLLEHDPREPLSEGQRRRVRLIHDAGEHLLRMIGDLLDLTRIESGHLTMEPQRVPLAMLARDCADMLAPAVDEARLALALPALDSPLTARADPGRLKQVLLNLLSNAIKYNRPGGQVEVTLSEAGGEVVLAVRDTGIGIRPEHLPRLFEPFNRLGQRSGRIPGTGIGLALTRMLVEGMDGRIAVDSVPEQGSCFRVHLPNGAAAGAGDAAAPVQVPNLPT
ncbi:hypothetical protein ISF6_1848 [Piscinibacter sakaiensis]|uniref:histidine kinase n=1 Tax=Piscinibacter sakaiensis TaxID=1547922 RepID=A0A0K8P052_PISS1|nr:hypothetical protein ISF6_1848 [Piscinibacter sakaiensis]